MADLYTKDWTDVKDKPVARVVFIHGFGEHVNAYPEFFEALNERNIEVYTFDQRGFGHSRKGGPKKQGCTGGWSLVFPDLDYQILRASDTELPLFLWGHSMGGGLALRYGISGTHRHKLAGVIAQAPMLRCHPDTEPNFLLRKALTLVSKVHPNFLFDSDVQSQHITRDEVVNQRLQDDPLVSSVGSLQVFSDMLNRGTKTIELAPQFFLPLLITHGTDDNVTCSDSSKEFYENAGTKDKTYQSYPGFYHSLHIEKKPEVYEYLDKVAAWIYEHSKPSETVKSEQETAVEHPKPTATTSAPSASPTGVPVEEESHKATSDAVPPAEAKPEPVPASAAERAPTSESTTVPETIVASTTKVISEPAPRVTTAATADIVTNK
ncbi:putative monoglyceride lipase [Schizosaccharomyces pombe]